MDREQFRNMPAQATNRHLRHKVIHLDSSDIPEISQVNQSFFQKVYSSGGLSTDFN